MDAAAHVTEAAASLQEVVADLVEFRDRFLIDLTLVESAAVRGEAALAGEVVVADLGGDVGVRVTAFSSVDAARSHVLLGDVALVDSAAACAEAAPSSQIVFADLARDVGVRVPRAGSRPAAAHLSWNLLGLCSVVAIWLCGTVAM